MNIYLTRHSQTEWNLIERIQGFLDSPLTEKGISDSKKLKDRLDKIDLDVAFSSSQGRAKTTAEIIMEDQKGVVIPLDNLKEISVGKWEGMLYEDIKKYYGDEFYLYTNKPLEYKANNGGETFDIFYKRVNEFVEDLKATNYENVLIVTHGLTVMMLLNIFEGKPMETVTDRKVSKGTSLSKIIYEDGKFNIEFEDDISHL